MFLICKTGLQHSASAPLVVRELGKLGILVATSLYLFALTSDARAQARPPAGQVEVARGVGIVQTPGAAARALGQGANASLRGQGTIAVALA